MLLEVVTADSVMSLDEGIVTLVDPANHSNVGLGESDCNTNSTEHVRVKFISPTVLVPEAEGEIMTGPMSTVGRSQTHN